jgi:hypothetical protein
MRLALGIMMLVMGVQGKDWAIGLFSIFFLYQAVTDTGCCSSGACYTPPIRKNTNSGTDVTTIEYEEIK